MSSFTEALPKILADVPGRFRGPGGVVAVLKDGEVVGTQIWGFADIHSHIPMSADTVIPICSISKQMLCGLYTDLINNPTPTMVAQGQDPAKQIDDQLHELLGAEMFNGTGLTAERLCHNQSGIRDYWGLTVLWGAVPEQRFSIQDHGPQMLERIRAFHFESGAHYSYCNTNYFILARAIERATKQPLDELLSLRIFTPAGMTTASLCADTFKHPAPCIGYEGDENHGFYPGVNRIEWAGDAGIVASLNDMIAYEKFVDKSTHDAESKTWYTHNSQPQTFKDGKVSEYGYGLGHVKIAGAAAIGHGGALRGYRLNRVYVPEHRISVVALLNQEHGDAGAVCSHIIKQGLLGAEANKKDEVKPELAELNESWLGTYLDSEAQLAITATKGEKGQVNVKYNRSVTKFRLTNQFHGTFDTMKVSLDGDVLTLEVEAENRIIKAQRVAKLAEDTPADYSSLHGDYRCDAIDSVFHFSGNGAMVYGSFDGFFGQGPVHLARGLATDVFALACPRAMDSSPPGDWTIIAKRDDAGKVTALTIGCWLARNLTYTKIN